MQATNLKKIFTTYISDKGFVSKNTHKYTCPHGLEPQHMKTKTYLKMRGKIWPPYKVYKLKK